MTAFFERITETPLSFDQARGKNALDTLTKSLAAIPELAAAAKLLTDVAEVRQLLGATFSGSPYLASLALRDPANLAECVLRDPDQHLNEARKALATAIGEAGSAKDVMALLRRFKQRISLLVGLADLGGIWPTKTALRP